MLYLRPRTPTMAEIFQSTTIRRRFHEALHPCLIVEVSVDENQLGAEQTGEFANDPRFAFRSRWHIPTSCHNRHMSKSDLVGLSLLHDGF